MGIESLNDEKINELLSMPKKVINNNIQWHKKPGHKEKNFLVKSMDNRHNFKLYVRQNLAPTMKDDFSCGLSWLAPSGETITLIRYNGKSHTHTNHSDKQKFIFSCHIHKATEEYINKGKK